MVWTFNGIALNHQYPFPSFADVGFVWYALPTSIGLILLLKGQGLRLPVRRTILDAGVVASSTFFIAWSSVLGPWLEPPTMTLSRKSRRWPIPSRTFSWSPWSSS